MNAEAYSIAATIMRYFFVAIIVYILLRIVYHSVCEYNELRRVKRWIENGYAKYIEFLPPFDEEEGGFILVKNNLIGRSNHCDICIDDRSVRRRHAILYERKGDGYFKRIGRAKAWINGDRLSKRQARLENGDLIRLGNVEFRYKLSRVPLMDKSEGEDE